MPIVSSMVQRASHRIGGPSMENALTFVDFIRDLIYTHCGNSLQALTKRRALYLRSFQVTVYTIFRALLNAIA